MKTYEVEEISLGDVGQGDRLVFKSHEDIEDARKEIDNGKDIYVQTNDGLETLLPHRMLTAKLYDGSIKLSARIAQPKEESK